MEYGIFCLVPVLVVLIVAVWTKDTFISLIAGTIVGFLMLAKGMPLKAFGSFVKSLYDTMMDEDTVWVLMLCALFGALIALLTASGGVMGFSKLAQKFIRGRKSSMITTWVLGIIVFVDDYLNCLAVGAATRDLTDKHKVSREMLAYIVNSTGVTVCAIVPISTWGGFMGGLMKEADMAGGLAVTPAYLHSIPFVLYGWFAVIMVPLFCSGIIPLFGPMKKAQKRALETGEVFSKVSKDALVELPDEEKMFEGMKCRALNFILPLVAVAALAIITDDIINGLFAAILLCFIMYLPQKLLNLKTFMAAAIKGFSEMFPLLILIILAYAFMDCNSQLGLTDFVINAAVGTLHPALLPVLIFVVIGLLSFASGSFWGLAILAFPIVAPVAAAMNLSPFLCSGAIISAVCFGGHICLYSDTVILTAASTQVTNYDYFRSSLPLIAVPFGLSAVGFLVLGLVMA